MRKRPTQNTRERVLAKLMTFPHEYKELGEIIKASVENLSARTPHSDLETALKDFERIVNVFYQQENSYFNFDAALIDEIMNRWTESKKFTRLSPIFPSYRNHWGYINIPLPVPTEAERLLQLPVIFIGREKTQVPQLDDYVWLIHELGHALCEANQEKVTSCFAPLFRKVISELQLSRLATRSRSKEKTEGFIKRLTRAWGQQTEKGSWAIGQWTLEILIDVLGVFVLGSAYIDAFVERNSELSPFEIDWSHPPVNLRAVTFLLACQQLGWSGSTGKLEVLIKGWQVNFEQLATPQRNEYLALKHQGLIEGIVQTGIEFLKDAGMTQLTPRDIEKIKEAARAKGVLNGVELIIAAKYMVRYLGDDQAALSLWEQAAMEEFMREL